MPRIIANYGPTLLVEMPDGTKQEVIRDSYERAFPGGQYPGQAPGSALGATQGPVPSSLLPPGEPASASPELLAPPSGPVEIDAVSGPPRLQTKLSPAEEREFGRWIDQNKVPFDPSPTADYDMRGYWKAMKAGDPRAVTSENAADGQPHYPDTFKTPYHRTFSNESIYATPGAPHWDGDRLVDQSGRVVADESPAPSSSPAGRPLHDPARGADLQTLPEYAQGTRDYGAARIDTAQDLGGLESAELTQVAGALDEHDRRARGIEDDRIKAHEEGLREGDKRSAEIDKMMKERSETTIDRGRLFANMSTGNKILAAIGLGLSTIGQAMSRQGGPNPALQIILQNIENDVQDQMRSIDKQGQDIEMKRGLYKEFMAKLGNKQAAYDMAVAVSAGQTKRHIEAIGAASDSQKVKLQAQDLAAQLGQAVADKEELIRRTASDEAYRVHQMRLAELKRGSGGKKAPQGTSGPQGVWAKGEGQPLPLDVGPESKHYGKLAYFGDQAFLAGTSEEATALSKAYSDNQTAISLVSNLRTMSDSVGWGNDYVVTRSKLEQVYNTDQIFALMKLKNGFGLGVLSGEGENSDANMLNNVLGKGEAKWGDIKAILKRTESNLESSFIEEVRSRGYKGPVRFGRAEPPPPPPTWDRALKNVMDSRLDRQDRIAAVQSVATGMGSDMVRKADGTVLDEGAALDTRRKILRDAIESVSKERTAAKKRLDEAQALHREAPGVSNVGPAQGAFNTADIIYQRLVEAEKNADKVYQKALTRDEKAAAYERVHKARGPSFK